MFYIKHGVLRFFILGVNVFYIYDFANLIDNIASSEISDCFMVDHSSL